MRETLATILRACLDTTVLFRPPIQMALFFRFKTERTLFSQQKRSPNGTVPFLPNRLLDPYAPSSVFPTIPGVPGRVGKDARKWRPSSIKTAVL